MKSFFGISAAIATSTRTLAEAQHDFYSDEQRLHYHHQEHSHYDHGLYSSNHMPRIEQGDYHFDVDAVSNQYWELFHNREYHGPEEHYQNQAAQGGDPFGMPGLSEAMPSPESEPSPGGPDPSASGPPQAAEPAAPASPAASSGPRSCYKNAYFNGKGNGLYYCSPDEEKQVAMCYKKCKPGYSGVGAFCYQDCPKEEFKARLGFCAKPKSYGRGAGAWKQCDDCEKWGLWWYKKCKAGWHTSKQFFCSRDCPDKMTDLSGYCKKSSTYRGLGHIMYCGPDQHQVGVWCWNKCKENHSSVGNLCFENCPSELKACAGVLCLTAEETCSEKFADTIKNVLDLVEKGLTEDVTGGLVDLAKIAKGMTYPKCRS